MIRYLLDTDICSYILKGHPALVLEKYNLIKQEDVYMSVATYAELLFGAEKTQSKRTY